MDDFYFYYEKWTIRYIVVATGLILSARKVLISPLALRHPACSSLHINVNLTCEQVDRSPSIDLDKPVSRQHEAEHHNHYGFSRYWEGDGVWVGATPKALAEATRQNRNPQRRIRPLERIYAAREKSSATTSKRPTAKLGTWKTFCLTGRRGKFGDAIIDTKNWWPGKKVLLRPQWINRVSWADREIDVNISREIIRKSPPCTVNRLLQGYELRLHKHYGYAPYWTSREMRPLTTRLLVPEQRRYLYFNPAQTRIGMEVRKTADSRNPPCAANSLSRKKDKHPICGPGLQIGIPGSKERSMENGSVPHLAHIPELHAGFRNDCKCRGNVRSGAAKYGVLPIPGFIAFPIFRRWSATEATGPWQTRSFSTRKALRNSVAPASLHSIHFAVRQRTEDTDYH